MEGTGWMKGTVWMQHKGTGCVKYKGYNVDEKYRVGATQQVQGGCN